MDGKLATSTKAITNTICRLLMRAGLCVMLLNDPASWLLKLIRFQTWFLDQFDDDERHGQDGNDYDEELKNNSRKKKHLN